MGHPWCQPQSTAAATSLHGPLRGLTFEKLAVPDKACQHRLRQRKRLVDSEPMSKHSLNLVQVISSRSCGFRATKLDEIDKSPDRIKSDLLDSPSILCSILFSILCLAAGLGLPRDSVASRTSCRSSPRALPSGQKMIKKDSKGYLD